MTACQDELTSISSNLTVFVVLGGLKPVADCLGHLREKIMHFDTALNASDVQDVDWSASEIWFGK